jgi:hypothetical protein
MAGLSAERGGVKLLTALPLGLVPSKTQGSHVSYSERWSALQKKLLWLIFAVLSTIADIYLPLLWGVIATLPIFFLSWWIVYRSGWLD